MHNFIHVYYQIDPSFQFYSITCRARMHSRFGGEPRDDATRAKSSRSERNDAPRGSQPVQVEVSGQRVSASAPRLDARRTTRPRSRSPNVVVGIARPRRRLPGRRATFPITHSWLPPASLSLSPVRDSTNPVCRREWRHRAAPFSRVHARDEANGVRGISIRAR